MLQNRLDNIGATILPLVYLIANIGATGYYFSATTVGYATIIGYVIASAVEMHAFLAQRRARRAWKERQKGRAGADYRTHLFVMLALVAFQCFTNIGYLVTTWHAPLIDIIVRGMAVPVFFLLTGVLASLALDAEEVLANHNAHMLLKTVAMTAKQHDRRVNALGKANANLSSVVAALWRHQGNEREAVLVEAIDNALTNVEQGRTDVASGVVTSQPTRGNWTDDASDADMNETDALVRLSEPAAKRQIRHLLADDPTLTVKQLIAATGLSNDRCSVYRREILAEKNTRIARVAVSA